MKLTSKLALALSLTIFLALSGYGILSIRRQLRLFETDMMRDDRILGQVLASALRDLWRHEGQDRALGLLDVLDSEEPRVQVRWRWLAEARPDADLHREDLAALEAGRPVSRIDEGSRIPRYVRTRVPLTPHGALPGFVEIADSLEERDAHVRTTVLRLIALATLILLLGSLVAWVLGIWIVGRPVAALVEKARRVGAGDLSGPLALTQKDELGTLALEMNEMCARLAGAREALNHEEQARRAVEAQLQHAERLATVGKLASGVAHELGTPLNVIGGRAAMIEEGHVSDEEARESAVIIREQAQRISRTIRQLLAFSRRNEPHPTVTDLSLLASSAVALMEDASGGPHAQVEVELPEESIHVEVDPGQVQQVLVNLLQNAFQAQGQGGRVHVRVARSPGTRPLGEATDEREWAVVEVRDYGPGIAPEDLHHVFEPFFTTKDIGEGTGLGLSVAYGIVEEHGGRLTVDSEPGEGATFRVHLPLARGELP